MTGANEDLEKMPAPTVGNWVLVEDGFETGRAARMWRHKHRQVQVLSALQVKDEVPYVRLSVMSDSSSGPTDSEIEFSRKGFGIPKGDPALMERHAMWVDMWFEIQK